MPLESRVSGLLGASQVDHRPRSERSGRQIAAIDGEWGRERRTTSTARRRLSFIPQFASPGGEAPGEREPAAAPSASGRGGKHYDDDASGGRRRGKRLGFCAGAIGGGRNRIGARGERDARVVLEEGTRERDGGKEGMLLLKRVPHDEGRLA
jgi:hypothetical protein